MDLSQLTADHMLPQVGTIFGTDTPDGRSHDLRLIEVIPGHDSHATAPSARRPFSLFFSGPPEPLIPQGTYPMHHDILNADTVVFIVPVARDKDGCRYQAVFS